MPHTRIQYPVYVRGQHLGVGRYLARVSLYVRGQHLGVGRYLARVSLICGHHHTPVQSFRLTIASGQLRQTYDFTVAPSANG